MVAKNPATTKKSETKKFQILISFRRFKTSAAV